jgi:hypothetical protein
LEFKSPVEYVLLTTKSYRKKRTTVGWDDGGKIGRIKKKYNDIQ